MEETIQILIYIHVFLGGIGLITGIGSILAWTLPTILGTFYIVYWKRKVTSESSSA